MCRKLTSLIAGVLVLGLAGSVSAGTTWHWTDASADSNSFCDPCNWKEAESDPWVYGVPGPDDFALIRKYWGGEIGPHIDCAVDVWKMEGPYEEQDMSIGAGGNFNIAENWWWEDIWHGPSTIDITGDPTVNIGEDWLIGYRIQNAVWTINVSGTPEIRVGGNMRSTYGDHEDNRNTTRFYLNMGGGSLVVDGGLTWGEDGDGGGGELNVSGGATITCATLAYEGGGRRDWTLNLDGGTIYVSGEFRAPGSDPNLAHGDANAFMNLDDGTLECNSFDHNDYPYAMDINEGIFIIHGDVKTAMEADVLAGYITAFNGAEDVLVEIIDGNTWVRADFVRVKAWGETPDNYVINVCPDANKLSWESGEYCVDDHNVYFGTSMSDVNEGASPYLEHHDTNSFAPSLQLGKTYYWRVDEVNDACDASPWVGDIWQFTTNDGSMYDAYPIDLAIQVDPNVELEWTSGCTAQSHDVYLGTDFSEVNDANSTSHPNVDYDNVPDANYSPPNLNYSTYYYWRVDEVDNGNTYKGRVWQFKTRAFIVDPNMFVWYKFDETSGSTAMDSSGHEIRGDIYRVRGDTWDPNDGKYPGCIHFHEEERIDLADEVFDYIGESISISVWWKDAWREGDDKNRFCGFGDDDLELLVRADAEDEDNHGVRWQAGNDSNDRLDWATDGFAWKDDWHHLVFTKNGPEGTMKIYFDSVVVASTTGASGVTLAQAAANEEDGFRIGTDRNGSNDFAGKADDFRVYDYEISQTKVNELFRGGDLGSAWASSPYDGQVDVPYDVNLSWRPGDYVNDVDGHDVYIGTDFDEVNDATSSIHPNVDYYNVSETNCDPGPLDVDQLYYWRVDEVNDSCSPYLWKGKVWKFATAEFIIIDDFEDYTEGAGSANPITDGWTNIYDPPYTGPIIQLGLPYYAAPVRGEQSMQYIYDNSGVFYSESGTKSLDPCDWTIAGMKMLTLWFHGEYDEQTGYNDANETEQLYVGVEDSDSDYAEVRYPMEDMDDIRLLDWTQWNVALSEFTSNNPAVELANIQTLYIGFGDRDSTEYGGCGIVYFDDIRLYPPSCVPSRGQPELDWDNDCIVSWGEIEIMADQWLKSDVNLAPVAQPDPCVLHYAFEDGTGSNVTDSSGNNYDGTAMVEGGSATEAFWEPNGVYGDCIRFENSEKEYCVAIPNDVFDDHITNQVTICVWVNWDDPETMPDDRNQLFSMHGGPAADYNGILGIETSWVDDDEIVFWDANNSIDYGVDDEDWSGGWNHYAFVKDVNVVPGLLKIYHNGQLVEDGNSNAPMIFPADNAWIGMATDSPNDVHDNYEGSWHDQYTGLLDDFRIYDYALSEPEIGYLASSGTGIVAVQSIANLVNDEPLGDRAVNFRDLSVLADDWLEQKLWPE